MDLTKVGEKFLSSVRSARSLTLLPSTSYRLEPLSIRWVVVGCSSEHLQRALGIWLISLFQSSYHYIMHQFCSSKMKIEHQMANRGNDSEVDGKKNMKWTQNMDKAFIEQLIRHGSELRINNGLTKEKWNAISTAISAELGFQLDVKHLKNHFKIWKSNYVQVRELRGLSGFEWDDKRKLVDAAESVWVDLIKAHPTMARWRYQTFPLYDDLAIIMGDAHATGNMSFTWNEPGFIDVGEGEDTPGSYNDQPPVVDVDGNNFTQADPNLPGSSYDEPSPTSTPTVDQGKKKKRKGAGDNLSEALGSMVHSLSRMTNNDTKKLEYFSKKDIEIGRMKDRILQFLVVDVNDRFKAMTLG